MDPFLTSSSPVSPKTHPVVEGKPKVDGEAVKNIEGGTGMEKRNCLTSEKSIQGHWGEASVDKGLSCKHGLGLSQHPHENSGYSGVCLQPQHWGSRNQDPWGARHPE